MDDDRFWSLVELARVNSRGSPAARAPALRRILGTLAPDDVIAFVEAYWQHLHDVQRWDLRAAAYVINGDASDEGFRGFCDWLISEGRYAFASALADPDSLAAMDITPPASLEPFGHAPADAFRDITGEELLLDIAGWPAAPEGIPWKPEEAALQVPRLARKLAARPR